VTRARIAPAGTVFLIAASQDLDPVQDELEAMRTILGRTVPIVLAAAAVGGWLLARKSLSPVVGMAEQARRMGAADLSRRLPVANPRDELGQLAGTFNELLDRIAEAFAQQRRFMADASHELRTPLAAIRAASSVTLQKPTRGEDEYREALSVVGDQARRITRLVEDMFTLARADAGHYPLRRERLYLDELLADAGRAAEVVGATRGIGIAVDSDGECPIDGDEDLLLRMVQNLIDNAMRHSPEGATVRVTLECGEREYRISVADSGPGIPEAARPRLFERFFRADESRTRDGDGVGGGAGLGLAIARWSAEAHGGRLELVRSSPGDTVFAAILPRP
jgi:heavy metal sensor kinase